MKIYGKEVRNWTGTEDLQWVPLKDLLNALGRRSCHKSVTRLKALLRDRGITADIIPFETSGGPQGMSAVSSADMHLTLLLLKPTPQVARNNPEYMKMWSDNWEILVEENSGCSTVGFSECSEI